MENLLGEGGLQARDVVDVLEAQDLEKANARPLTQSEWTKIWARARRWNGEWKNGPRKAFFRIQRELDRLTGLKLEWATAELGLELHFAIPELGELLEPYRERAYALLAIAEARREKRPVDVPLPQICKTLYQVHSFRIRNLKKKVKLSAAKAREQLELGEMRVTIRPARRARVEEDRDPDDVKQALEEWDTGAPLSYVAWILRCSKPSARRFLERHARLEPPSDPPGVPARHDSRACALLATFGSALRNRLRAVSASRLSARRSPAPRSA